jgi:hypothetical protein
LAPHLTYGSVSYLVCLPVRCCIRKFRLLTLFVNP